MTNLKAIRDSVMNDVAGLAEISNPELRNAVVSTWSSALRRGGHQRISDVPQSKGIPDRGLREHVNEVTHLALVILDIAENQYGIHPDRDVVVAAAILHDVDKSFIQGWVGDGMVDYLPPYGIDDHGSAGAQLAIDEGIPPEVAALVRDHAPFNYAGHLPGTVEGTIIHYADLLAADLAAIQHGATPIHARSVILKRDHPLIAGTPTLDAY